jgi:hypothetical protein
MCTKYESCTNYFESVEGKYKWSRIAEFLNFRIPEKAKTLCPPIFSGVGCFGFEIIIPEYQIPK